MKKINIMTAGIIAFAGIFAGCNKEVAPGNSGTDESGDNMVKIRLSAGETTKTMLTDDFQVHWHADDKILLLHETWGCYGGMLENVAESGANAVFEGSIHSKALGNTVAVLYPYQDYVEADRNNKLLNTNFNGGESQWNNLHIPAVQKLQAGTYDRDCNKSMSWIDLPQDVSGDGIEGNLVFKNITGLVEFKLKGNARITKVELVTPNFGWDAGPVGHGWNVGFKLANDDLEFTFNYPGHNEETGSTRNITMIPEETIQLTEEYQAFYACLMPYSSAKVSTNTEENKSYQIIVTREDGSKKTFMKDFSDKDVKSGRITPLGKFIVNEQPPVPEVLYLQANNEWVSDNARFAAYFFYNDSKESVWRNGIEVGDNIYAFETPGNEYPNVIFCRMNPATSDNNFNEGVTWNQLPDEVIPRDGMNMMHITWNWGAESKERTWKTYTPQEHTVLYLKPNTNWNKDNARFAAYFYGEKGEEWVDMTDADSDGTYEVNVPEGYLAVIFCRMNPSTSENTWDNNNKWTQTGDLGIRTDAKNLYTITENADNWGAGSWSAK